MKLDRKSNLSVTLKVKIIDADWNENDVTDLYMVSKNDSAVSMPR